MAKLIVIMGATGKQGGSVVRHFLDQTDYKVRGITRDPTKASSIVLANMGVEVVAGDVHDIESLKNAFLGANLIFAVTDFWAPFFDPANKAKLKPGETINEWSYENELQHGKNIADAVAASVVNTTLDLLVWSTLSAARKWSNGKYKWVYHFDSKAAVSDYIAKAHPVLNNKTSQLQMSLFMTNWSFSSYNSPNKQPDGTYVLAMPGSGDSPHPVVDADRDTGMFVHELSKVSPGKTLLGHGSMISSNDYMKLWGNILGVEARYEEVPVSVWEKLAPGGLGIELGQMMAYSAEYGYDGRDPNVIYPRDLGICHLTTKIEDYVRAEDWSSIIN